MVWLKGELKTPSRSNQARLEAGLLLRRLQQGARVESAPFATNTLKSVFSATSYEIIDRDQTWRIVYHVARDAIVILDVFSKKTQTTPVQIVEVCQKRLAAYLRAISDKE